DYTHPDLGDPTKTVREYIYRITSNVNPAGLTPGSGSANCIDVLTFSYSLDGHTIDLDLDGKTHDDTVRLLCDSSPYSLTGANAIVRVSKSRYSRVCIHFSGLMKSEFMANLNGGQLCAPVVPAGYDYGTGCSWCPGILTASMGPAAGAGFGGAGYSPPAPTENRPGAANPSSI
ncbi:hypothetical protein ACFL6I_28155, partial [candidate division KSB1 bacterium]